ncbi:MAG: putative phage protein (TIGR01671 family) [Alteromonadaceae bacterium]|jgi:uncharacterized phage protein (TIGR01671 family)
MREIKFSCMWSDGKSWMDLRYTLDEMCNNKHWGDLSDLPMLKKFVHKHTRQYTGLKDKNGVEIYEGDVVKVWHEDYPELFEIGKVWWFDCYYPAFDIYTPNKKTGTGFESYSDEFNSFSCPDFCFEVIGNIYENKELMEDNEK